MNQYMAYEAVNTKIVSREGQWLNEKEWQNILEYTSVEQVTAFFRDKDSLKKVIDKSKDMHRADLEVMLYKYKIMEIENILHYFSGPYKNFLQTTLMTYDIAALNLILRKIVNNEKTEDLDERCIHSQSYTNIPYEKLLSASNVNQFTENLKGTIYFETLKTLTDDDLVKREFHTEMKLEALYYKTLITKYQKLNKADMAAVKDIIGIKIDFANVQWIYRATKYYDISPEEILIYSLPSGKRISYNILKKLCYTTDMNEFKEKTQKYLKCNIFESSEDYDMEIITDRYIYNYLCKADYEGTIGKVLSYIYMLDIIVKDLVAVTEGIKYKLPKESLEKYLAHRI